MEQLESGNDRIEEKAMLEGRQAREDDGEKDGKCESRCLILFCFVFFSFSSNCSISCFLRRVHTVSPPLSLSRKL